MKIYLESQTPILMRVTIKRQGDETQRLTLCECEQNECLETLRDIIKGAPLDIFYPKSTTVEIREYVNHKNGKIVSFNFRGLSPLEVKRIFLKYLSEQEPIKQ